MINEVINEIIDESINQQLYTTNVPFEENIIFGDTPLYAIVKNRTDEKDEDIIHIKEDKSKEWLPKMIKKEGCITKLYDIEKGRVVKIFDTLNTSIIKDYLCEHIAEDAEDDENDRKFTIKDRFDDIEVRKIVPKFGGNSKRNCIVEEINDILVFRFYRFNDKFFNENLKQAYHETTRVCFSKDECWRESYDGKRYNFDIEFVCNKIGQEYSSVFFNYEQANEIIKKHYPIIIQNSNHDDFNFYNPFSFFAEFMKMYKGNRINKNVPFEIQEHLYLTQNLKDDKSCKKVQKEVIDDFLVFYYFNKVGDNTERLYFTKTKCYRFGLNQNKNQWVSTNKHYMSVFRIENKFNKKTNTIFDYYINLMPNKNPTFAQILMAYESPLIEKLYKLGFDELVKTTPSNKTYYNDTHMFTHILNTTNALKNLAMILDIDYNKKVIDNLDLQELLYVSPKQIKFIDKNMLSFRTLPMFRFIINNERVVNLFTNIQQRLAFTQVFINKNYSEFESVLTSLDDKELLYIGKIAMMKTQKSMNEQYGFEMTYTSYQMYDIYRDYKRMRIKANEYNKYLQKLTEQDGLDRQTFYYKEYPKVSSLLFLHNKANRDVIYFSKIEKAEKLKLQTEKIKEFSKTKEYQHLLYNNDEFEFVLPESSEDLITEGSVLSHCVGTYCERLSDRKCKIIFLREKSNIKQPFYTLEIVNRDGKESLNQCYTYHDTIEKTAECKQFIKEWAKKKKITIDCLL